MSDNRPTATTSLDALAADPTRATELSAAVRRALTLRALAVIGVLAVAETPNDSTPVEPEPDRLLTVAEAAERLGTTKDWLRRHQDLPFVVRLSPGQVRYSARGISQHIARRR